MLYYCVIRHTHFHGVKKFIGINENKLYKLCDISLYKKNMYNSFVSLVLLTKYNLNY